MGFKVKAVSAFVCLAIFATMLAGCGGSSFTGRYNVSNVTNGEVTLDAEQLESLGMELYIEFKDDGSYVLNQGGAVVEQGSYTTEGNTATLETTVSDNEPLEATKDGDTVKFSNLFGEEITFTKVEVES